MAETKNDEIAIAAEAVMNQIYNIRGNRVMLDLHLALLYGVENRVLKQAVIGGKNKKWSGLHMFLTITFDFSRSGHDWSY